MLSFELYIASSAGVVEQLERSHRLQRKARGVMSEHAGRTTRMCQFALEVASCCCTDHQVSRCWSGGVAIGETGSFSREPSCVA